MAIALNTKIRQLFMKRKINNKCNLLKMDSNSTAFTANVPTSRAAIFLESARRLTFELPLTKKYGRVWYTRCHFSHKGHTHVLQVLPSRKKCLHLGRKQFEREEGYL